MRAQAWTILVLLAAATAAVQVRGDVDKVPASLPLDTLPSVIGAWSGTDVAIAPEVRHALGNGTFLSRTYLPDALTARAASAPVDVFIGYYPTQRTGQAIHSPLICIPGAGWTFESSGTTAIDRPGGAPYRVGEYLIANATSRVEVLYWYQSQGRSIANDYQARLYTLVDSIRSGRTDAALVRITTPLLRGESREAAHDRAVGFASRMAPLLPQYIPD